MAARYLISKSNMTLKTTTPTVHKGETLQEMLLNTVFLYGCLWCSTGQSRGHKLTTSVNY